MKTKTLLLTVFLAGSLVSLGQDTVQPRYQSIFGDSNTIWFIYCEILLNGDVLTETWQAISNDTVIIDGNKYNILRTNAYGGLSVYASVREPKEYVRESADHSKLYFKQNIEGTLSPEVLIMDMDLNIGDTLDTHNWSELYRSDGIYPYNDSIPTIRIDTIYYRDGRKYCVLTTKNIFITLMI